MPKRIQRKRSKGWKMPPDTIYVGRPTKWGNPWRVGSFLGEGKKVETVQEAISRYKHWLENGSLEWRAKQPPPFGLRGRDLACWCPLGQPCHADVLLEIANGKE